MGGNASGYSRTGWENAISAAGLDTVTLSTLLPDDISGYSFAGGEVCSAGGDQRLPK